MSGGTGRGRVSPAKGQGSCASWCLVPWPAASWTCTHSARGSMACMSSLSVAPCPAGSRAAPGPSTCSWPPESDVTGGHHRSERCIQNVFSRKGSCTAPGNSACGPAVAQSAGDLYRAGTRTGFHANEFSVRPPHGVWRPSIFRQHPCEMGRSALCTTLEQCSCSFVFLHNSAPNESHLLVALPWRTATASGAVRRRADASSQAFVGPALRSRP